NGSLDGAMRQHLPLSIALRVQPFEPDMHVTGLAIRLWKVEVAAKRDRNIAMQLDLYVIELAIDVRRRLPLHIFNPARLGVDLEWCPAIDPPIAMREEKRRRKRLLEKRRVTAHDGRLCRFLESDHFGDRRALRAARCGRPR